jgi:competence protein ComEC
VAAYALVLPLVFAGGIIREPSSHQPLAADAVARHNDGVAVRIRGVLRDDPETRDTSQRMTVSVRAIERAGSWERASGGVLVRAPLLPRYRSGDVLELEGKLLHPPEVEGMDYAGYLARRGIGSVMEYPYARAIGHDDDNILRATLLRTRRTLSRGLSLALPEPQAALAQGVLLGERSSLPQDLRDELNATNTAHLVVVSGSNVVFVSSWCTLILGWFMRRRRAAALSMLFVLGYAALVGLSPPVMRATIMGGVLILAGIAGRRTNGLTSLFVAAAVMTGWQPSVVRDLSFQLSFAATAGILYLAPPLRLRTVDVLGAFTRRDELPRWVNPLFAEPFAVTVAATVATAPLLALNFERASLVALPANLLIVPAFPLILSASFIVAVGGAIPHAHVVAGAPAYFALTYWLALAGWFAGMPGAALSAGEFTAPWAIAAYACAGLASFWLRRSTPQEALVRLAASRPMRWRAAARRGAYVAPMLLLLGSAGWLAGRTPGDARLEVTIIDVGQGDAILIETPAGRDVLVDGGPGRAVLRGLGEELSWHDRSLDLVVLTHGQSDHALGLLDVLDRYDVHAVAVGIDDEEPTLVAHAFVASVRREGAELHEVKAGDSFDLGGGVRLDVVSPVVDSRLSGNDASLVLRLVWRDVSFLLAADAEAGAEAGLLKGGEDIRSTVLKVAHHGSATSTAPAFVAGVEPRIAVISAGAKNAFGHPDPRVVERLSAQAAVYHTAIDGSVHFETDGHRGSTLLSVDTE